MTPEKNQTRQVLSQILKIPDEKVRSEEFEIEVDGKKYLVRQLG